MELEYLASFGDHVPYTQFKPDDTISVLAFSSDGRFLASGDQAGRVVIFSITPPRTESGRTTVSFVSQIHAHKAEFDYFRSELSEMKVNSLKWVPTQALNPLLLTCNGHDAKLWKMDYESKITWNQFQGESLDTFILPQPRLVENKYTPTFIKTFTDLSTEYLVDLQCLSDQRSFLMIDVGGVKLWDIEKDASVSLCKVSQQDPEITTSAIHSSLSFAFLVADDAGQCRILDMRQQTEDLTPSIQVETAPYATHPMESCENVTSVAFSPDGSSFVARTFGDLQLWDLRQTSQPINTLEVQWFPKQMDFLVSDDYVKDCFRTSYTASGKIVTGQYSADFVSWNPLENYKNQHRAISARTARAPPEVGADFARRVTCCEAHPTKDIVAVVSTAALFVFQGKK